VLDAVPIGRSGRRNGREWSNKGMRSQARGQLRGLTIWVIRRLPLERRAQGIEQTITGTAQGTRVAVVASPQCIVTSPRDRIYGLEEI
jgi:hypothetical protein